MAERVGTDLRSGARVVRAEDPDERLSARHLLAAVALHLVVLGGALLVPAADIPAETPITVELVLQEGGEGGAAGGTPDQDEVGGTPEVQPARETRPETQVAKAPPIRPPSRKPQPRPAKAEPKAEPKVADVPAAEPEPAPAATAPSVAASSGAPIGEAGSGVGGPAGRGHGTEGEGAGAFGSGDGPGDEYFERLRRHLARYKRYPDEAIRQKQQGTVMVEFVLARDGTVLQATIEKGSGYPLIDRATLEMLERASPVPPLPDRYKGERIKIAIPVEFSLGFFSRLF